MFNFRIKMSSRSRPARIYVGNLPPDIRVSDIKELFDSRKYGKISDVDLKNEKGPPFAFVEFENQASNFCSLTRLNC